MHSLTQQLRKMRTSLVALDLVHWQVYTIGQQSTLRSDIIWSTLASTGRRCSPILSFPQKRQKMISGLIGARVFMST
jgi:hypothetical protein